MRSTPKFRRLTTLLVCPWCGAEHDSLGMAGGTKGKPVPVPRPGDAHLCFTCGSWGFFKEGGTLRRATLEEIAKISCDPQLVRIYRAWQEVDRIRRLDQARRSI